MNNARKRGFQDIDDNCISINLIGIDGVLIKTVQLDRHCSIKVVRLEAEKALGARRCMLIARSGNIITDSTLGWQPIEGDDITVVMQAIVPKQISPTNVPKQIFQKKKTKKI